MAARHGHHGPTHAREALVAEPGSTKRFEPWVVWEPCDDVQASEALSRLAGELPGFFADSTLVGCQWSRLSFYRAHRLMELQFVRDHGLERAFVLHGPELSVWLDGRPDPIHEVNDLESLALTESMIEDYIHFFFYFLRCDGYAFVMIESAEEVRGPGGDAAGGVENQDDVLTLEAARDKARPIARRGLDATGRWLVDATVAFRDSLFATSLAVGPNGAVEMLEDDPIGKLGGLAVPEVPVLESPERGLGATAERPRDREVTEAIVAVLLGDAITESNSNTGSGNVLLRHFNSQARNPIEQLKRLMSDSKPTVIIESDIPFVEDFVAALAAPDDAVSGLVVRASAMQQDDVCCEISLSDGSRLYLLSFHTYRALFDAERAAHELAISEASVLIGCNRADEVPQPLRRTADLVITFPPIDRRRFARIFERVFHAKPTAGWDAPGADWTRYLVPADFHTPRHLALGPDEAVSLLRDRVEARLAQVTPDLGLRLDELHGLGEARQIAQDLIDDIRAAQAGTIPWSAVDRGLLLIGAPGTGKTTLARAIAKDCGVKFVVASASRWQSAGALDAHLRAMRADFAESHRYAPAILFIDELDSIGSREHLADTNAVYQTEVINALLAEIQGIDTIGSVIVIGATNYPEKVDPALRRAGRLDQVVEIPRPNIDGLEQIFDYYVSRYQADGGKVAEVDTRALAELAFGLTGADVEAFIRGAARRARREGRPVAQIDLVAEVTRRPRRPESAPQLGPEEMHRVAVHEAGHAVALLTSSTKGEGLTFASIIPRLDGSMGFTAAVPARAQVLTRRAMLEQLETVLAGRAAEEAVFGADDVGAGAGGPDRTSDLAVATRLATLIVCQSGLGDDGGLYWTTQPTGAQEQQIEDLLSSGLKSILARLQVQRDLLNRVAAALEEKQEVSGKELRRLAELSGNVTGTAA